ncbi:hypothetical protein ACQPUH_03300 [Clostridium perfringens]|uniref:hypothetical protein n=1 Tax=Clostridium perfringens TaxID=1502 RepID=UPI001CB13919|nr:hypothetical protein [Clostridium perfringens]MDB2053571.1 hypothetical protein [Clostridium perfringens]MDK0529053.1 hypothetical protein [Clostridium perfringens]MDK0555146.1 hypothetical protein [Clostridium perfringens]MDK0747203.1 hypothetical protein [Clostridium perfringens]MDK0892489.1 hypothetical protein [Clostridium perfringens]
MRKEQLTKELKSEGVENMSVIREDFIRLSKQEIMLEDLQIIKEITGTSKITKDTVPDLLFALQSHLLLVEEGKTELNTEFTETISLLVAKLYNR